MKIALVYDHVNKIGGAERVLTELHKLYPEAPLFTPIYNLKKAPWATNFDLRSSFMQKLPFASDTHELYPGLPILAIEQFDFKDFDVVISVTSAEAKGIITPPNVLHICYCLTPTRYLWSHYQEYFQNRLFRFLSLPLVSYLRQWDFMAAQRPDVYVSISKTVTARIKKYYQKSSALIYPPVDTDFFQPNNREPGNYFLIVSRLVTYKHVEIAIGACNTLKIPLKIVGTGLAEKKLKRLAGPTIEFMGQQSDLEILKLYQNCRAFISTSDEDFGISTVEVLACGRPVLGLKCGGTEEIVEAGITGELFWPQTKDALEVAIRQFAKKGYNSTLCRSRALAFSQARFKQSFSRLVKKEWSKFKREI